MGRLVFVLFRKPLKLPIEDIPLIASFGRIKGVGKGCVRAPAATTVEV